MLGDVVVDICYLESEIEAVPESERGSQEHLARVSEFEALCDLVESKIRRHRFFSHLPRFKVVSASLLSVTLQLPNDYVTMIPFVFAAQEESLAALERWAKLREALPRLLSQEH